MSVDTGRLVSHLNQYLECSRFEEGAINGLQVAGAKKVKKIAFAVDGVLETFEKAADAGADMLIVHHGIFWGFQYALRGPDYKRIKVLMDNNIALYAVHLPLDAHAEVGHNANLLKALGADLEQLEPFGRYKGTTIGFQARIPEITTQALAEKLSELLKGDVQLLPHGPKKVRKLACITGQGADFGWVREAKINGVHFFISGEATHPIYHFCKENQMNLALGGHYATETFGLHALRAYLESQYDIETCFIDCPTGM